MEVGQDHTETKFANRKNVFKAIGMINALRVTDESLDSYNKIINYFIKDLVANIEEEWENKRQSHDYYVPTALLYILVQPPFIEQLNKKLIERPAEYDDIDDDKVASYVNIVGKYLVNISLPSDDVEDSLGWCLLKKGYINTLVALSGFGVSMFRTDYPLDTAEIEAMVAFINRVCREKKQKANIEKLIYYYYSYIACIFRKEGKLPNVQLELDEPYDKMIMCNYMMGYGPDLQQGDKKLSVHSATMIMLTSLIKNNKDEDVFRDYGIVQAFTEDKTLKGFIQNIVCCFAIVLQRFKVFDHVIRGYTVSDTLKNLKDAMRTKTRQDEAAVQTLLNMMRTYGSNYYEHSLHQLVVVTLLSMIADGVQVNNLGQFVANMKPVTEHYSETVWIMSKFMARRQFPTEDRNSMVAVINMMSKLVSPVILNMFDFGKNTIMDFILIIVAQHDFDKTILTRFIFNNTDWNNMACTKTPKEISSNDYHNMILRKESSNIPKDVPPTRTRTPSTPLVPPSHSPIASYDPSGQEVGISQKVAEMAQKPFLVSGSRRKTPSESHRIPPTAYRKHPPKSTPRVVKGVMPSLPGGPYDISELPILKTYEYGDLTPADTTLGGYMDFYSKLKDLSDKNKLAIEILESDIAKLPADSTKLQNQKQLMADAVFLGQQIDTYMKIAKVEMERMESELHQLKAMAKRRPKHRSASGVVSSSRVKSEIPIESSLHGRDVPQSSLHEDIIPRSSQYEEETFPPSHYPQSQQHTGIAFEQLAPGYEAPAHLSFLRQQQQQQQSSYAPPLPVQKTTIVQGGDPTLQLGYSDPYQSLPGPQHSLTGPLYSLTGTQQPYTGTQLDPFTGKPYPPSSSYTVDQSFDL